MKITINGKEKEYDSGLSLNDLVSQSSKTPKRVIVEVNGNILKNDVWDTTSVQEGDTIELVTFVGGG